MYRRFKSYIGDQIFYADVAELVDALVLGTSIFGCESSSLSVSTKHYGDVSLMAKPLVVIQLDVGSNPIHHPKHCCVSKEAMQRIATPLTSVRI